MNTYFGIQNETGNDYLLAAQDQKGTLVKSFSGNKTFFFVESDEYAEALFVSKSIEGGIYHVKLEYTDKRVMDKKEKSFIFDTKGALLTYLNKYMDGIEKFFVSGFSKKDRKTFIKKLSV